MNKYLFYKINNLLLFNYKQINKSVIFWILFVLNLICQPTINLVLYYLFGSNILSYSIFFFLIPLICSFILLCYLIFELIQNNKYNSVDYKMICSKYSRKIILFSRVIFMLINVLIIVAINDIFLISFLFWNMPILGVVIFISNTFISPFIYLFLISCLVLLTYKLSKISFLIVSFILCFCTFGISLISRSFIHPNTTIKYDTKNVINYSKYVKDNDCIVKAFIKNGYENQWPTPQEIASKINQNMFVSNFIPSEWILCFYSTLFEHFNFNLDFDNNTFNLLKVNLDTKAKQNIKLTSFYEIRPIDFDFTTLSSWEYQNLLLNNIDKIIKKYKLMDKDNDMVTLIQKEINTKVDWNTITNQKIINFLQDATGVNRQFNQLFYFIKYNKELELKAQMFLNSIKSNYNVEIANLFDSIFHSVTTNFNLFKSMNVLKTNKDISYFYPMSERITMDNQPILDIDKEFIKNVLIKFVGTEQNDISFLENDNSYSVESNLLASLQQINPKIVDYQSWSLYIDKVALTMSKTKELLNQLKQIFPTIYNYQLSANVTNIENILAILKPYYSSQLSFAYLFICFYILLFLLFICLIINKYKIKKVK